ASCPRAATTCSSPRCFGSPCSTVRTRPISARAPSSSLPREALCSWTSRSGSSRAWPSSSLLPCGGREWAGPGSTRGSARRGRSSRPWSSWSAISWRRPMAEAGSLELKLHRVWSGEGSAMLRGILVAAAGAYRGALLAREACYGAGIFSTGRLSVPVISIGNITLGGSGKTPLTALVAAALRELGAYPAVLSRGYGRRTRGVHVVWDRVGGRLGAREAGDEPRLLAEQLPGLPVVVGESRHEAGRAAIERLGADALVLDDGFQHRTLAKDLEILAVQGREPWGNGRLFPRGILREPLSALRRAHLVVVTNPAASGVTPPIEWRLRREGSHGSVLTGSSHAHAFPEGCARSP